MCARVWGNRPCWREDTNAYVLLFQTKQSVSLRLSLGRSEEVMKVRQTDKHMLCTLKYCNFNPLFLACAYLKCYASIITWILLSVSHLEVKSATTIENWAESWLTQFLQLTCSNHLQKWATFVKSDSNPLHLFHLLWCLKFFHCSFDCHMDSYSLMSVEWKFTDVIGSDKTTSQLS